MAEPGRTELDVGRELARVDAPHRHQAPAAREPARPSRRTACSGRSAAGRCAGLEVASLRRDDQGSVPATQWWQLDEARPRRGGRDTGRSSDRRDGDRDTTSTRSSSTTSRCSSASPCRCTRRRSSPTTRRGTASAALTRSLPIRRSTRGRTRTPSTSAASRSSGRPCSTTARAAPTNVRCSNCHEQAELTDASVRRISAAANGPVRNRDGNVIDKGFNNIGVRPTRTTSASVRATRSGRSRTSKRSFGETLPPLPVHFRRRCSDQGLRRRGRASRSPRCATSRSPRPTSTTATRSRSARSSSSTVAAATWRRSTQFSDGALIEPLGVPALTEAEVDALVAFMEALTDERVRYAEGAVRPPGALRPERTSGRRDDHARLEPRRPSRRHARRRFRRSVRQAARSCPGSSRSAPALRSRHDHSGLLLTFVSAQHVKVLLRSGR